MKFTIQTVVISVAGSFAGLFFPFWSLAIVAFIVAAAFGLRPFVSFLSGLLAIFSLWVILSFLIDQDSSSLLTNRVAQIFMGISNITLVLITGLVGGIVGGFGAASGALFRALFNSKKDTGYYAQ